MPRKPAARKPAVTKIFVLDTNVLMHDPSCLYRFEEHDIFLPIMTLEELDNNKKGMSEIARNARQASRTLDEMLAHDGVDIDEGIDLYRQDFNIDPLAYWRANDAPDRQGLTDEQGMDNCLLFLNNIKKLAEDKGVTLTREERTALIRAVLELRLPISGDRGFRHAEVTAGGVPLSEVHLESMESRVCPGLYLCGEMLDVDGRIGGYNFQWAWASGHVAGRAVRAAFMGGGAEARKTAGRRRSGA